MSRNCIKCGTILCGRSDQIFCSSSCRYKYYHSSCLVLILKKQWFDMILSGVKTEEYREIKPYWKKRFQNYFGQYYDCSINPPSIVWSNQKKSVIFRNGYHSDARQFTAECTIREGTGREEWGAECGKQYYILSMHKIFDVRND